MIESFIDHTDPYLGFHWFRRANGNVSSKNSSSTVECHQKNGQDGNSNVSDSCLFTMLSHSIEKSHDAAAIDGPSRSPTALFGAGHGVLTLVSSVVSMLIDECV